MALKQSLSFKLQQKLSPQQIQLMKLLQLPTVALEQRIKEEMESNPALDEGREEEEGIARPNGRAFFIPDLFIHPYCFLQLY